jgi:hypothetical protein
MIVGAGRLELPAHVDRDYLASAVASSPAMARKSSLLPV